MSLRHSTALSDPGRKRRHNEDSYVCEPPIFAVADGMGGAQAGEIASQLAAASLRGNAATSGSSEARVIDLIQEANRSVYERASVDEAASGMGTTMTVALVDAREVWFGHVGDSRAYLVRDDRLEQLTEDHSLVAELVRSGKLSPEEACVHPHRSVITRALGTDPEVEVDAFSVETRPGDVFMLCSDGLTSMVDDETILRLVEPRRDDLEAAARALVQEANRAGGEDNITVILFQLNGLDDTIEFPLAAEPGPFDDEDTLTGADAVPTVEAVKIPASDPPPTVPRNRRRLWRIAIPVAAIVLAGLAGAAVFGLSRAHFVGAQGNGRVAVYQGLPWNLPFGVRLYRAVYESPLLAVQLSPAERKVLFDHDLLRESAAIDAVKAYEQQIVE